MPRKVARQDEPMGAHEDEAPSCPGERRVEQRMVETEDHRISMVDTVGRPSPTTSVKFAIRAACFLAGRAADKLVSLYTRAFSLDRDYILNFNKSAGLAHVRHRQWNKAIPLLEQSLVMAPDDAEIRMRLAEGYAATSQHEKACQQLEKILEMDVPKKEIPVRPGRNLPPAHRSGGLP